MNIYRIVPALLIVVSIIFSCQKELSQEGGGPSLGTLKADATGDCLPIVVNGIFKADSILSNGNYIDVQVDITRAGAYLITSDSVNGYSFRSEGFVGNIGLNTVRLNGFGKPLVAGTNTFTIQYGTSTCLVDVTVVSSGTGVAVYTLAGTPGACTSPVINGTYTVGVPLDPATNTVTVTVNVTSLGLYAFGANSSPAALTFAAAGTFTTLGVQQVTLSGIGTPTVAGNLNTIVSNMVNTCNFNIPVLPGGGGGGAAVFTLNSAAGVCSGAIVGGTFAAGVAVTAANTVTLTANVVTAGTYTIIVTPATTNGYGFTGSGTFTGTGPQTVVLTSNGTPVAAGTNNFTATAGPSTCTFSITVTGTAPTPNLDYIPETTGSNWSSKLQGGTPDDTTYIKVNPNTVVRSGQTYRIFEYLDAGTPYDSAFHRKNGGLYYEYYGDVGLDNPVNREVLLLDSNAAVNATWTTDLGNNSSGGIPFTMKINGVILAKGATATIQSISYSNIIKVKYTFIINPGTGDVPVTEIEIWYAKGKGEIYSKVNDVPPTVTDIYEATRIQIF